jgi:hypothetical protein
VFMHNCRYERNSCRVVLECHNAFVPSHQHVGKYTKVSCCITICIAGVFKHSQTAWLLTQQVAPRPAQYKRGNSIQHSCPTCLPATLQIHVGASCPPSRVSEILKVSSLVRKPDCTDICLLR